METFQISIQISQKSMEISEISQGDVQRSLPKNLHVLGGSWGRAGGDVAPSLPRRPREDVTVKKEKKERERQRDGHGRGRGRPEVIQSHSIFEQGPAEMMKKKGKGSSPLGFLGGERSLLG